MPPLVARWSSLVCFVVLAGSLAGVASDAAQQPGGFKAIHGVGEVEYQAWIDSLRKTDYRPAFISAYGLGQTQLFAAGAVQDAARPEWVARHHLTSQGFQREFDKWTEKGYHLISVVGYLREGTTQYAALWLKDNYEAASETHFDQTVAEYQATFKELSKKGFRPVFLVGYPVGKSYRLASIFVADRATAWTAFHDLTEKQYQKTLDDWTAKDYRPISITAYPTGQGTRFGVILIEDKAKRWKARHNLTAKLYEKQFDAWKAEGYRPIQVCGYPWQNEIRYAAVAIKPGVAVLAGPLPMTGDAVPELTAFDDAMQKFMRDRNILAGTLAVSKNKKVVLSRGYGHVDDARTHLCGPATPMRIASVSKPITLAALFRLIREGKLSLKTKAFVFLDVQPPPGQTMDPRLLDITVGDLVEHKGGWDLKKADDPMFMPLKIAKALGKTGPADADDVIVYMAGQPLQYEPGSKYAYSNFGYCVLGRVIEKASGKRYIDYLHEAVTGPLGLTSIQLGRTLPKNRNPAEPVYIDTVMARNVMLPASKIDVPDPDGGFHLEAMDAHGGLIASAPDLVKLFDVYWMNGRVRKPGDTASFKFFGSLPGTWAFVRQGPDGVTIAALFNQRTDPSGLSYDPIEDVLNAAAKGVKQWPK
jgi:CubicO group peptidase (beta-lactamase class C family)